MGEIQELAGLAGIGMLGTTSSMGKSFSHVQHFNMSAVRLQEREYLPYAWIRPGCSNDGYQQRR